MNVWTTKDGTKIPLRQMTEAHLRNSRAMLLRQADALLEEIVSRRLPEEGAPDFVEDDPIRGGCDNYGSLGPEHFGQQ